MSEYKRGDFDPSDQRSLLPELKDVFERPKFAPTPLNPYDLKKDGVSYIKTAQAIIGEVFSQNLARLNERPSDAVIDLLETSVMSALFRRFENNGNKQLPEDCDDVSAELFSKACLGQATPDDLIELLRRNPNDLKSTELAKQTHPFDWNATADMDVAIDDMLNRQHFAKRGSERSQNARYYYMRSDNLDTPTAIMFVRKADLGVMHTSTSGAIVVVQRDSFVLDLKRCETKAVFAEIEPWLRSPETRQQMQKPKKIPFTGEMTTQFLASQLETRADLRSLAMYPGVRSYYAHYEQGSGDDDDLMIDA
jgi:hypothetical protein